MTRSECCLVVALMSVPASAACRSTTDAPAVEMPSLDVTSWTDKTELFMEYPPLAAGQRALFAVHLTTLADFTPLTAGRPSIEFVGEAGGTKHSLPGSTPSRPGAFRVEGAAPAAGRYRWALVVEAPGLTDRHDLGLVTVFADQRAANAEAEKRPAEDPSSFVYLKEQQWTNPFATDEAGERELRSAVRVPATIEPLAGGDALVSAPAAGRFTADSLVPIGASVTAGQMLGRLEPRLSGGVDRATLTSDVAEARAAVDAAHTEYARADKLLAERAIPARRLEDARRSLQVAEARLESAEARLAQRNEVLGQGGGVATGNAFVLRSPIDGRVVSVFATLGAAYDEGTPLFRVVRTDRVALRAYVPAVDVSAVRNVSSLALEVPGRPEPIALDARQRRDSAMIDPTTRALTVQFDVANPGGQLLVGQTGTAVLYTNARERSLAVSTSAVLFEAGRPYVFVQVGGERFARRNIQIGRRDDEWVGVSAGLKAGDRVVTRGAYEVQLASAARGLPAEGHVH